MKINVPKIGRYILGVVLVFFGSNSLFPFFTPPPSPEKAQAFWAGLAPTGYFIPFLGLVLVVVGLMLLFNKWVPLALVILAPISVQILLFHLFLDPGTILLGLIVVLLNLYLGVKNFKAYKPMFK